MLACQKAEHILIIRHTGISGLAAFTLLGGVQFPGPVAWAWAALVYEGLGAWVRAGL